jgi:predicted esterase
MEQVPHDSATRLVYVGFSQGVAMAFRAGVLGGVPAAGIIAVGGDVPPELIGHFDLAFPAVLFLRGLRDTWLTGERFDRDAASLRARHVALSASTYDGAHEWNDEVSIAIGEFLSRLISARV